MASFSTRQKRFQTPLAFAIELLVVLVVISLQTAGQIRAAVIYLAGLGVLSLWLRGKGLRSIGLRGPLPWRQTLLAGLAAGAAYQAFSMGVVVPLTRWITGQGPDVSALAALRGDPAALLAALAYSWLFAVILEEFVFRGYLLNRLLDLFGATRAGVLLAMFLSAAGFGALHLYQGPAGVIDNLLFGFVLAVIYLAGRRNLWLPVIAHGTANTLGFLLIALGFVG